MLQSLLVSLGLLVTSPSIAAVQDCKAAIESHIQATAPDSEFHNENVVMGIKTITFHSVSKDGYVFYLLLKPEQVNFAKTELQSKTIGLCSLPNRIAVMGYLFMSNAEVEAYRPPQPQ